MHNVSFLSYKTWIPALLAGTLFLPGCKRPHYTPRSLDSISPVHTATQTHHRVTLSMSPLSKQEAKQLFDNRGDRLVSKRKPLHPILITIKNESDKQYTFDPQRISLKLTPPHKVARKMYGHTGRHIIAPLVLGSLGATVCFFGAAYLVILGTIQQVAMPALVKAGYTLLGISGLVAVGTPVVSYRQGLHTYELNTQIDQDVWSKTVFKPLTITPGSTTSFLLFVEKRKCPLDWQIVLTDQDGSDIVYQLRVLKGGNTCIR